MQFTQVHKITRAFLLTRRVFWRHNPTACASQQSPTGLQRWHLSFQAASRISWHFGRGSPCCCLGYLGTIFPTASGVPQGGDSGQEGNSQRHQPKQKTQIITTSPRAQVQPKELCPTTLRGREGDEAETPCRNTLWKDDQRLFSLTFLLFPTSKASSFILRTPTCTSLAHTPSTLAPPRLGQSGLTFVSLCAC